MYVKKDGDNTGDVYWSWSHMKKSVSLDIGSVVSASVSLVDLDIPSALVTLSDGTEVSVKYSSAGANHDAWTVEFEPEVKTYK
ncbi:MAG: hypothetical protein IJC76_09810 [Lachnospiraceae bacterium]|nr:hypothetical protein [Lachnospiraceae bacterium]